MEKPIGYDLKTNIEEQITEWKRINSGNEDK
jgi:DNA-binding PadR family transcriptional regulator